MAVSLNPKDAVKGGLVLQDVDGTITSIRFHQNYTYPNTNIQTCALVAEVELEGGDKEEAFWSVGSPSDWVVSEDGMQLDSVKNHTGVTDSSNFFGFTKELLNAGFPTEKLTDRIDVLQGLKAHWIQKAQPKRAGLVQVNERERTFPVPEKILVYPWDAKNGSGKISGGKKAAAGTSAVSKVVAAAATAASNANDLENEVALGFASAAIQAIKESRAGETIVKTEWAPRALAALSKTPGYKETSQEDKSAATRLMKNADFLAINEITVGADGSVTVPA